MFERNCNLFEIVENDKEELLGEVELRIIYDDDVFGARIVANFLTGDYDDPPACNHLIAMQTTLDTDEATNKSSWSALDFSTGQATYRTFKAAFKSADDMIVFKDTFYEGKELADQSEILELPEQPDDPCYYGAGGDYEGSSS